MTNAFEPIYRCRICGKTVAPAMPEDRDRGRAGYRIPRRHKNQKGADCAAGRLMFAEIIWA